MTTTEKDLLICRIVDREDSPTDWARLDALAAGDRDLYESLIDVLRDESALRSVIEQQVAVADTVELAAAQPGLLARHPWLPQWSGWIAAAVLALVWMAGGGRPAPAPDAPQQVRSRAAGDDVLRELPNILVETRALADGGKTEVIYVRRTLERAVVDGAYATVRDELGQPVRTQVDLATYEPRRNY